MDSFLASELAEKKKCVPAASRLANAETKEKVKKDTDSMSATQPPPEPHFELETRDVTAMASLMYAMKELVRDVRIYATTEGIRISECTSINNIMVTINMPKRVFESFSCSGDLVLSFIPERMYKCLSRHTKNTSMTWRLEAEPRRRGSTARHYFLAVSLRSESDIEATDFEYVVPLLAAEEEAFSATSTSIDYMVAMDTTVLVNNIIDTFVGMENQVNAEYVTIKCSPTSISFEMEGGGAAAITSARCRISLRDPGGAPPATAAEVVGQFSLKHLDSLKKAMAINKGYIFLCLRNNYPLIFKIAAGTLGDVYITLMYRALVDSDDEDEDIQ